MRKLSYLNDFARCPHFKAEAPFDMAIYLLISPTPWLVKQKNRAPDLPVIFLFLSGCGWNQESPGNEVVSIDANSTIHDFVEEEGGYWAANDIGEAQTAVSGVMY